MLWGDDMADSPAPAPAPEPELSAVEITLPKRKLMEGMDTPTILEKVEAEMAPAPAPAPGPGPGAGGAYDDFSITV